MNQPNVTEAHSDSARTAASKRDGKFVRKTPPRAPLAFRVGVVGHRPNRLAQANLEQLAGVLRAILGIVKEEVNAMWRDEEWLFDSDVPVIRAISPFAEGTDRIFAEQALAIDFELCCVMPFAQAEFERDFAEGTALESESLARFRGLVARASTRFELDGCRDDEGGAYGAAGRTVLNQSDLLVVVWDGQRQAKRGGTEETLDDARRTGVPVVWVDAHSPHHWQILDAASPLAHVPAGGRLSPDGAKGAEALRMCVRAALDLPKPKQDPLEIPDGPRAAAAEDAEQELKIFYAERQPRWTVAVVWNAFRDVIADGKFPTVNFSVKPFEQAVKLNWPEDATSPVGQVVDRLRPFYAWTDKLAVIYSNRYRSAFIVAFLLAAFSVGMALLPLGLQLQPHHGPETLCIVLELSAILIILGLVRQGRRARWHERWIDYRLAAELVRNLRIVAPLGGGRPFPQIPAHWATYGQPGTSWMAWYVRAVERTLGLPTAVVNKDYLEAGLGHLDQLVNGQIAFHKSTQRRCHLIESRLHRLGIALLLLTLASCGLHLLPNFWNSVQPPGWVPPLLTFFCGFFPALGAALAGIVNQGEFRRVEKRSKSMHDQLKILQRQIEIMRENISVADDPPRGQFSVQAAAVAVDAAHLLLNEVLDWRVVFLDRPLVPS